MLNRADYNFVVKYGEVTPDGVAVYDLNSRSFVYVNRFLRQILNLESESSLKAGNDVLQFIHPEDMEYVEHRYREMLSIGCMAPPEFRVRRTDGSVRTVSAEVLWLEESYTFALFVKDITAAKEHEDYIVKISAQKDTLLDMLLHDLSGPLYLSRDVIALLSTDRGDPEEARRLLGIVSDTTGRCIDIVQQFLQVEHTESVEIHTKKSRFNIFEKSQIVVDLLKEMNKEKNISLNSSLSDNFINSDPIKYCQIIHNLLSNAVKYTREDGKVAVHIAPVNNHLEISVSDNGVGVAEDVKHGLFKRKVHGKPGLRGEPSQGMGLFLCGKLAHRLGAEIRYESSEKGSVFTLDLPLE